MPEYVVTILTGLIGLLTGLGGGYFGLRGRQVDSLAQWQTQMVQETHALRTECQQLRQTLHERDLHIVELQSQISELRRDLANLQLALDRHRQE